MSQGHPWQAPRHDLDLLPGEVPIAIGCWTRRLCCQEFNTGPNRVEKPGTLDASDGTDTTSYEAKFYKTATLKEAERTWSRSASSLTRSPPSGEVEDQVLTS